MKNLKRIVSALISAVILFSVLAVMPVMAAEPAAGDTFSPDWSNLASTTDAYSFYAADGAAWDKTNHAPVWASITELAAYTGNDYWSFTGKGVGTSADKGLRVWVSDTNSSDYSKVVKDGHYITNPHGSENNYYVTLIKFTAPVAGNYSLSMQIENTLPGVANDSKTEMYFFVGNVTDGYTSSTTAFSSAAITKTADLEAGDEIIYVAASWSRMTIRINDLTTTLNALAAVEVPETPVDPVAGAVYAPNWSKLNSTVDAFSFYVADGAAWDKTNNAPVWASMTELGAYTGKDYWSFTGKGVGTSDTDLRVYVADTSSDSYSLMVKDGHYITNPNGSADNYYVTVIKFTAPVDGKYTYNVQAQNALPGTANDTKTALYLFTGNGTDGYTSNTIGFSADANRLNAELKAGDEIVFVVASYGRMTVKLGDLNVTLNELTTEPTNPNPNPNPNPDPTPSAPATSDTMISIATVIAVVSVFGMAAVISKRR